MEINISLPKIGKSLLNRLSNKEISVEEFDKECAYWLLEFIEELRYRPMPTKPREVEEYYYHKRENPDYRVKDGFWEQPEVRVWKATNSETISLNKSNWYWLNELKRIIPQEDNINHSKIDNILKTHKDN